MPCFRFRFAITIRQYESLTFNLFFTFHYSPALKRNSVFSQSIMKVNKTQIILVLVLATVTAVLYVLPKKVLTNKKEGANRDKAQTETTNTNAANFKAIDLILKESISELTEAEKKNVELPENASPEILKKVIDAYAKLNNQLGIAFCLEKIKEGLTDKQLGLAYYEAFKQSLVTENKLAIANKVTTYLNPILEKSPDNEIKCAIADINVNTSDNPMTGITLLREVIASDSVNESALFLLGEFAIKSGQFDKAEARFESLVRLYPSNIKYSLYLAQLFSNRGARKEALETLTRAKKYAVRKSAIDSISNSINHLK